MFIDSNNLLVQELFQCKLTRKGTIAPSDRQSRLRKSIENTFDSPSSENIHNTVFFPPDSHVSNGNGNSHQHATIENNSNGNNKVRFAGSIHATNGFGTMYPPIKNGAFFLTLKQNMLP